MFIESFVRNYGALEFELSPTVTDVRAFSWWNYHEINAPRFEIEPIYTAQLTDLQSTSPEQLLNGLRRNRRREIRAIESSGRYLIERQCNLDEVVNLYGEVFYEKKIAIEEETHATLKSIGELSRTNWAFSTAIRDKKTQDLVSFGFVIRGHNTPNMVLALTRPDHKKTGIHAWLNFNSIL